MAPTSVVSCLLVAVLALLLTYFRPCDSLDQIPIHTNESLIWGSYRPNL